MKKALTLILAVLMTVSLSVTCFAASLQTETYTGSGATTNGSITLDPANEGESYNLYKLFDATYSTTTTAVAYTYTCSSNSDTLLVAMQAATNLFIITLQTGTTYTYNVEMADNADTSDFTQFFADFFKTNPAALSPLASATVAEGKDSLKFDKIPYGYYYLATTTGTLISIDTAKPSASAEDKNELPTLEKTVKGAGDTYGDSNSVNIGDTVDFKIEIGAKNGAINYVLVDKLTGFSSVGTPTIKATPAGGSEVTLVSGTHYTSQANESGIGFTVTFKNDYLATITVDTSIVITYSAVVSSTAALDTTSNTNVATLSYGTGDGKKTDSTVSKLMKFVLDKTDGDGNALSGVVFNLYADANHTTPVKFTFDNTTNTYAYSTEGTAITDITTNGNNLTIGGFGAGTYYLYEKSTLAGYNKLTEDVIITIDDDGNVSSSYKGVSTPGETVTVVNNAGTVLPTTGGAGTTVFIVIGMLVVLGAGIFLVTNKRMEKESIR